MQTVHTDAPLFFQTSKHDIAQMMHDACTVKPVLSGHSKEDQRLVFKTNVLSGHSKEDQRLVFKTDYCLMQVISIAECSFCNTFDLH